MKLRLSLLLLLFLGFATSTVAQVQRDEWKEKIKSKLKTYKNYCNEIVNNADPERFDEYKAGFCKLFESNKVPLYTDFEEFDPSKDLAQSFPPDSYCDFLFKEKLEYSATTTAVIGILLEKIKLVKFGTEKIDILVYKSYDFTEEGEVDTVTLGIVFNITDFTISEIYKVYQPNELADQDSDGVVDKIDKCPVDFGIFEHCGCKAGDKDGDKVLDSQDECPTIPGLLSLKGCPDIDLDNIPDKDDACPKVPGKYNKDDYCTGCPDEDNDGICDYLDKCPNSVGSKLFDGCPDSDNDRVIDIEDQCPYIYGIPINHGCPLLPFNKWSIGIQAGLSIPIGSFASDRAITTDASNWLSNVGFAKNGYAVSLNLDFTPKRYLGAGLVLGYNYLPFNDAALAKNVQEIHAAYGVNVRHTGASSSGYHLSYSMAKVIVGLVKLNYTIRIEPMLGLVTDNLNERKAEIRTDYSESLFNKNSYLLYSGVSLAYGTNFVFYRQISKGKFPLGALFSIGYWGANQTFSESSMVFDPAIPIFRNTGRDLHVLNLGLSLVSSLSKNNK